MTQISKTLQQFGLSENEVKIYLACLGEDNLSPFKLANLTKIPRTTVYEVLMSLSLKGLVSLESSDGFTKQQTRVKAKNPSVLRDLIWQKKRDLSALEVNIVDILPQLKGDYHRQEPNADFQFFPGIEGAKKIYYSETVDDNLVPIHVIDNLMPMDVFGRQPINQDVQKATDFHLLHGGEVKEVVGLTDWAKHVLSYQYHHNPNYYQARQIGYIDNPNFLINQRLVIQGSLVKITTAKDEEVWGLQINSKTLAQTFESIFQFLWSFAKPVTSELIESWGKNDFFEAEKKQK